MKEKAGFNFTEIREVIRIKQGRIRIKVLTASGKSGDHFVMVSPSLLVSGYGDTEEEARESFEANMEVFCHDLMSLSSDQRETELRNLGFMHEKFNRKNYSKAYVDENGVLQGLDPETKKVKMLEAAI